MFVILLDPGVTCCFFFYLLRAFSKNIISSFPFDFHCNQAHTTIKKNFITNSNNNKKTFNYNSLPLNGHRSKGVDLLTTVVDGNL